MSEETNTAVAAPEEKQPLKQVGEVVRNGVTVPIVEAKKRTVEGVEGEGYLLVDSSSLSIEDVTKFVGESVIKKKLDGMLRQKSQQWTNFTKEKNNNNLDLAFFTSTAAEFSIGGETINDLEESRGDLLEELENAENPVRMKEIVKELKNIAAQIAGRKRGPRNSETTATEVAK